MSIDVKYLRQRCCSGDRWAAQFSGSEMEDVLDEVERLQTWDGLITILDKHYPVDVPLLSDPAYGKGPRLVAMIREVNQLQQTCDEFRCASLLVGVAGDAEGVQPHHVESHISELRAIIDRIPQYEDGPPALAGDIAYTQFGDNIMENGPIKLRVMGLFSTRAAAEATENP